MKNLKLLSNKTSSKIIEAVKENPGIHTKELYKLLGLEQSVTSIFLSKLRKAGYVETQKVGQNSHHTLCSEKILADLNELQACYNKPKIVTGNV